MRLVRALELCRALLKVGHEVICGFDIRTGTVLGAPAWQDVKSYRVRVFAADVEIEV
jgi:nitrite reductase/ring-hydroxylating ferredoxin subunit